MLMLMRSSASLVLRRQALDQLVDHFNRRGLKQGELADLLAVSDRANALTNGHVEQFSLDALVDFRAELTTRLTLTRRYGRKH